MAYQLKSVEFKEMYKDSLNL